MYRYLALESMCLLATSEFSHEAVKKHQETVITALKVNILNLGQFKFIVFIVYYCVVNWVFIAFLYSSDGERCECTTESRRFVICYV